MNWKSNGLYTNKLKNSNKTKKKLGKKNVEKSGFWTVCNDLCVCTNRPLHHDRSYGQKRQSCNLESFNF